MKAVAVEIEVDGPHNESLGFRPLQRNIRGRLDLMRCGEPMARIKATEWPPIPGQRLAIDPDGNAHLIEPLHSPEHAAIREKIAKAEMGRLEPAIQTFENVDLATFYFWMRQAVEAGIAKVIRGQLPDVIEGPVRKNFLMAEPEQTSTDKLTAALERQSALFERLLERLGEKA